MALITVPGSTTDYSDATVQAQGNALQTALNNATPLTNDIVELTAGAEYGGPIRLPIKSGMDATHTITLRTSALASLPAGVRVVPSQGSTGSKLLAQITSGYYLTQGSGTSSDAALYTEMSLSTAASFYTIQGIEFRHHKLVQAYPEQPSFALVWFGHNAHQDPVNNPTGGFGPYATDQKLWAQCPNNIIMDRCLLWSGFPGPLGQEMTHGIELHGEYITIKNSSIYDIKSVSQSKEAHGIQHCNSRGNCTFDNNYIAAGHECFFVGGDIPNIWYVHRNDADGGLAFATQPNNGVFTRNHVSRPLNWNPLDPSYDGSWWPAKNMFELKMGDNWLIDSNTFENSFGDLMIDQHAHTMLFTPRGNAAGISQGSPFVQIHNTTVTNNHIVNCGSGIDVLGCDDYGNPAVSYSGTGTMDGLLVRDNVFEQMGNYKRTGLAGLDNQFSTILGTDLVAGTNVVLTVPGGDSRLAVGTAIIVDFRAPQNYSKNYTGGRGGIGYMQNVAERCTITAVNLSATPPTVTVDKLLFNHLAGPQHGCPIFVPPGTGSGFPHTMLTPVWGQYATGSQPNAPNNNAPNNITFDHNTFLTDAIDAGVPVVGFAIFFGLETMRSSTSGGGFPMVNLKITNNIIALMSGGFAGTSAGPPLNSFIPVGPYGTAFQNFQIANNVFIDTDYTSSPGQYVHGYATIGSTTDTCLYSTHANAVAQFNSWSNGVNGDYRLKSTSTWKGAATDGTDIGSRNFTWEGPSVPTAAVTLTATPSGALFVGQAVSFTASISGTGSTNTPTGTVQFKIDGSNFGTPVSVSGTGTTATAASNTTSTLVQGNHTITAVYSGDTTYPTNTGTLSVTVQGPLATKVTINSQNPAPVNTPVQFAVTVALSSGSGSTPQGNVQLSINTVPQGSPVALSVGGTATLSYTFTSANTYTVSVAYQSNDLNQWQNSTGTILGGQVIGAVATTTTVTGNPNPVVVLASVTFTATVAHVLGTSDPTGNVQFAIDGTNTGTPIALATVAGVSTAAYATSGLAVGTHNVKATYTGDSSYSGSSNAAALWSETVQPAGGIVAHRAQAIGWETGDLSEGVANGSGVSVVSTPTAGSSYALKLSRSASAASFDINGHGANKLAAFYSLPTAYYKFDFQIEPTPPPSGEFGLVNCNDTGGTGKFFLHIDPTRHILAFNAAGSLIGTGTTALALGQWYRIEFKVGTGSSAAWEVRINGATELSGTASLGTNNNGAIKLGGGSNYTSIQYYDNFAVDGQDWCGPSHIACLHPNRAGTYSGWGPGNYTQVSDPVPDTTTFVTASASGAAFTTGYQPSSTFSIGTLACIKCVAIAQNAGSAAPINTRLRQNNTNFDASASVDPGTAYVLFGDIENADMTTGNPWTPAAVDGLEFGVVSQSANGVRCTYLALMVETVLWNVPVTLSSSPNPARFGDPVTFSSTVTSSLGTPTGNVQFQDGGSNLGGANTLSGGVASFTTTNLSQANHTITAVYSGDGNFQTATSSALTQTVTASKATSTTTMTSLPNPAGAGQVVTFTATINKGTGTQAPTGSVQFQIDSNQTRTPVNVATTGNVTTATDNISTLTAGGHSIVAAYSGDNNYTSSVSSAVSETIQQGFSLVDGLILVCTSPTTPGTPTGLIGIDLATGTQTQIAVGGNFVLPETVRQGPDGHLYVADYSASVTGAIIKVNSLTGAQSVAASGGSINGPIALAVTAGFIYVANGAGGTPNLVEINLTTGTQRVVSSGGYFQTPVGLVLGTANNIYWADEFVTNLSAGAILSVNLTSGAQTILTQGNLLNQMIDLEYESATTLLAFNAGGAIIRVNTNIGAQAYAYQPGNLLANLDGGTVDINHAGLILVSELAAGATPARIVSINPTTNAQTVVSSGGNLALVTGLVAYTQKTVSTIVVTTSGTPSTFGQNVTFTARIN